MELETAMDANAILKVLTQKYGDSTVTVGADAHSEASRNLNHRPTDRNAAAGASSYLRFREVLNPAEPISNSFVALGSTFGGRMSNGSVLTAGLSSGGSYEGTGGIPTRTTRPSSGSNTGPTLPSLYGSSFTSSGMAAGMQRSGSAVLGDVAASDVGQANISSVTSSHSFGTDRELEDLVLMGKAKHSKLSSRLQQQAAATQSVRINPFQVVSHFYVLH